MRKTFTIPYGGYYANVCTFLMDLSLLVLEKIREIKTLTNKVISRNIFQVGGNFSFSTVCA